MTNVEVLEKAVTIAANNGWDPMSIKGDMKCSPDAVLQWTRKWPTNNIIFNHSFAKSLWPNVPIATVNGMKVKNTYSSTWQYHLQQMVLADDPIKYLADNI